MVFFVIFVFAAVILGVGTMLAPALPTAQPRVGLASTLALTVVISGGILWTRFVGWDTLVIDYLLFGIVSLVVLGGTMVQAHHKAIGELDEAEVEIERISRGEIVFFVVIALICIIPLFFPRFTNTESTAITQSISAGEPFSAIANEYPAFNHFGAISFHVLSAYLSQQLQQDVSTVHIAVWSVLTFLTVLTAYDFGAEIKNTRLGEFVAIGMLILLGIAYFAFEDFANLLMGVLFVLAFLILVLRSVKYRQWQDILGVIFLLLAISIL